MNAAPVLQAIVERCTGLAADGVGALPSGIVGNGIYQGQDDEARSLAALGRPQFSARFVGSAAVNGSNSAQRTHRVTVELTTAYHFHELTAIPPHAKNALVSAITSLSVAIEDALTVRGGLDYTANGEATLIVSGVCSRVTASRMGRMAPKPGTGIAVEWTHTIELFVESMTPAGPLMSTERFTDSAYWQGTTSFASAATGTKRLIARIVGGSDSGYLASYYRSWAFNVAADSLSFLVTSFTTIYVDQLDVRWKWPTSGVDGVVIVHGVCDGSTESMYVGGVKVTNTITIDAAPSPPGGQLLTVGRHSAANGFSSGTFGICHLEGTADVMSASEIARDAALCMSTFAQRGRFPALSNSAFAFDARDASGSTWVSQRDPTHILAKTGSPLWRAV